MQMQRKRNALLCYLISSRDHVSKESSVNLGFSHSFEFTESSVMFTTPFPHDVYERTKAYDSASMVFDALRVGYVAYLYSNGISCTTQTCCFVTVEDQEQ